MIRWTTPVSRKGITYQTERVGTTKIRRVICRLLLFNKHERYNLQIQTHCKIPKFAVYNENCTTQRRVACTKPPENQTFSDENSDSGENDGQHEGDNVDCDPTLEATCSSSETHLLTQGYLNDLAMIWNCLNNTLNSWTNKRLCQGNGSKQRWNYICEK